MKNEIEKILSEYTDGKETLQEATTKVLRLFSISGRSEHLKAFCQYCETRQIEPKRFKWDEVIKDYESI